MIMGCPHHLIDQVTTVGHKQQTLRILVKSSHISDPLGILQKLNNIGVISLMRF